MIDFIILFFSVLFYGFTCFFVLGVILPMIIRGIDDD